ncbi:MAG TPA: class I tRNA ligase family protein, partial [Thermoplasmata archaeon]|nr:class I tRNA ligase family protein [Thermoplasmata archaeon]
MLEHGRSVAVPPWKEGLFLPPALVLFAAWVSSMGVLAEKYQSGDVERSARDLWTARGLPRSDGIVGRSTAPIVRQFEGSLISGDDPGLVAFRAVAADVDARYLALAGRRALGTLRRDGDPDEPTLSLLRALSIWTGGAGGAPVDAADRRAGIEVILGRLASLGLVVTRDTSLRVCPSCAQACSPERILYQQEEGDTYLVRFPVPEGDGTVHALVWVDAPWRLLGASALLVSPTLPYVVARYRRRGVDERILTSRPSLARLLEWLPGGEVEVLEEGTGSRWQGRVYQYPLRHEFPMGGELTPPSGTVLAVPDVTDSGTGIVPLVPGHGGTDSQIADRLGIAGWPLVTARGQLDFNIAHKYSGLDIATANEFVARDLGENGALFARLRVRRGVPHCAVCGTALAWAPGRAWCLEPSRLPAERRDLYRRLLPNDPPVGQVEVAAWPVSEPRTVPPGPLTVTLLECPGCERLAPVRGGPDCPCGGRRLAVTRRLLPSMSGALGAWARFDPFPAGDSAWLYVNERRRAPALVHHLAAMSGVAGVPSDIGLTLLPGVPEGGVAELAGSVGADAVRAALVRGERRERSGPTFPDRCRQEARRLERLWNLARETVERCDPAQLAAFAQPIAVALGELESEDRAILARWERARLGTLADFDHQAAGAAHRRLAAFVANDLEAYFARVRPRLDLVGTPPSRRAALRTLHHLLRGIAIVLAPVSPHLAETIYGALVPGRTSLFEASIDPLDSALLDDAAIKAWDRWGSIELAVDRFRRRVGLAPASPIPSLVAVVGSEDLATSLRVDRPTIQRLAQVVRFEAFGPATPWTGRQRSLEPVLSEIQKAYPQEAGQILHVLRRMPARRRSEGVAVQDLTVVVRGLSRKILPSMVEYVETLPERIVPVPWTLGELYAELPAQHPVPTRNPPPVSPDAFRLLSRVERELRRTAPPAGGDRGPVLIAAADPLSSELRSASRTLAAYLGVSEVRVVDPAAEFPRSNCLFGRTRTGVHWWVRLPGEAARPIREKHRVPRARLSRVRSHRPAGVTGVGDIDFAGEEELAKEEQIRALVQELDGVLGAPLLGPAKVAGAWAAGFHSMEDFSLAPFDRVEQLVGFGGPIAESLVRNLGGVVPPRSSRPRSRAGDAGIERTPAPTGPAEGGARPDSDHPIAGPGNGGVAPVPPSEVPFPSAAALRPAQPTPSPSSASRPLSEGKARPMNVSSAAPAAGEPSRKPDALEVTAAPAPAVIVPELLRLETPPWPGHGPARASSDSPPTTVNVVPASDSSLLPLPAPAKSPDPLDAPARSRPEGGGPAAGTGPEPSAEPTVMIDLPVPDRPPSEAELPASLKPNVPPSLPEAEVLDTEGTRPREEPNPLLPSGVVLAAVDVEGDKGLGVEPEGARGLVPSGGGVEHRAPETEVPNDLPTPQEPLSDQGPPASPESPPRLLEPEAAESGQEPKAGSTSPAEAETTPEAIGGAEASAVPIAGPDATQDLPVETGSEAADSPAARGVGLPSLPIGSYPGGMPEPVVPFEAPVALPPESAVVPVSISATSVLPGGASVEPPADVPVDAAAEGNEMAEPAPSSVPETTSVPEPRGAPLPPPTPSGGITLVVAPSYVPAFARFLDATAAGHRGVCVVRESPDRLRGPIGPRPVEIYWLTNIGRGLTLRPGDLDAYGAFLHNAVAQDRITAFFLEGIEYL